jgi:hypothetical protein
VSEVVKLFEEGEEIRDSVGNGNLYSKAEYKGKEVTITKFSSEFSRAGFWTVILARETEGRLVGWTVTPTRYLVKTFISNSVKQRSKQAESTHL